MLNLQKQGSRKSSNSKCDKFHKMRNNKDRSK